MANSLINWKRGDYVKLSKAVKSFNRRVKELEANGNDYLPELRNYEDLKKTILTRKELNRVVNSLKRFRDEGMNKKVELPSGQVLTKWEYRETKLARNRAIRRLEKERISVMEGEKWVGMGDERINQIEGTIESFQNIESLKGYEFQRRQERILKYGETDINLKRADLYKENFMKSLEEMSTYDNYDILKNKLESIKNPEKFFEYIQNNDVLRDLFLYYKDKATAQTYGGFASNQDAFNFALEELGLLA